MRKPLALGLCLLAFTDAAVAAQTPHPGTLDHRARHVDYQAEQIYTITAFFGYHVAIMFAADERVDKISAGYADAWEVKSYGNFITVQPKDPTPATDLVVTTNRHLYVFDLRAKLPPASISAAAYALDPEQIFTLQFRYPDDERAALAAERASEGLAQQRAEASTVAEQARLAAQAALPPKPNNTHYLYQGEEAIAPFAAWDDGTFTYLRFYAQQDLPTPFVVNEDRTESTANKHFDGDVMVIERVSRQFVLRKGQSVVCVYNENTPAYTAESTAGATERGAERRLR